MDLKKLNEDIKALNEEQNVVFVNEEVAKSAEEALKAIAVVIDLIEDEETIAKLEEAGDLLRNMVPDLQ